MKKLVIIIWIVVGVLIAFKHFGEYQYVQGRLNGEKSGYGWGVFDTLSECADNNCRWIQDTSTSRHIEGASYCGDWTMYDLCK